MSKVSSLISRSDRIDELYDNLSDEIARAAVEDGVSYYEVQVIIRHIDFIITRSLLEDD